MSLRSRLSEITSDRDLQVHPARIRELKGTEAHNIEMLETANPEEDFNCVMYALNLRGSIGPPCSPLGHYYMGTEFMQHLISEGHVAQLNIPAAGGLVIYQKGDQIMHVGIVQHNGMVRSKWGAGHLYEHSAWEIPDELGDSIRYFGSIDPDQAFEIFRAFHEG